MYLVRLNFTLLFIFLLFQGCSYTSPAYIKDVQKYTQQAQPYLRNLPTIDYAIQMQFDQAFNQRYFKPWHQEQLTLSKEEAMWGNMYASQKVFGENFQPRTQEWFKQQINNSNFEAYNTLLQKAITIRNSSLRVFPTISKIFYNPHKAGEGFPFDYNQNSGIKLNSPLLISHYSKDKAWVFVQSSFATGWIASQDIALVDDQLAKKFETGNYYIAIKDKFALYKEGIFKEYVKIGTLFPKTHSGKYLTIYQDIKNRGFLSTVTLNETQIDKKPIKFNAKNVQLLFNQLINEPYGWGELLQHRDCSALTRDFLAPFGMYLGRNSSSQIKNKQYIDVSQLHNKEKKEQLLQEGIPFLTLVYLKGHIMLYIGAIEDEPLIFHNIWGIKTLENKKEGRFIIGKAVVTTLEAGKELYDFDESSSLLSKMEGFAIVTQTVAND